MLMAMEIDTNHDHFRTNYSERVKEKQAAERAEEAKGTEAQRAGKSSQPQDEYISSEKSGQKPSGLYRAGQDAKGNRKIFFEDPKAGGKSQGQPAECFCISLRVKRDSVCQYTDCFSVNSGIRFQTSP